jgi:hypothetical protein
VPTLGMAAALTKLQEAVAQGSATSSQEIGASKGNRDWKKGAAIAGAAVIVVAVSVALGLRLWSSNHNTAAVPVVAVISDKSIAVLPFTDMSDPRRAGIARSIN